MRLADTFDDGLVTEVIAASAERDGDQYALAQQHSFGQTALMWAAAKGCVPLCALLLNLGSEVDAVDSGGWTALFRACWHGQHAALKMLVNAGADLNTTKAKYTPLMAAARFGHYMVVRELLSSGADASVMTSFGETALSLALHLRHGAVAELLQGCCLGRPLVAPGLLQQSCPRGPLVPEARDIAAEFQQDDSLSRHYMNMQGRCQAQLAFDAAIAGI
jgi:ankyrin repeat protein